MDDITVGRRGLKINGDSVKIIHTPEAFYQELLTRSAVAKHRITLSSLYLGDGELENKLVDSVSSNLTTNSDLNVTVLLDFLRGTRGASQEKSSTSLLKRIAQKAKVYLYHTPSLSGLLKRVLPERTNEIVGLQHMKLYIFDDSVVISGANLSKSYFTNRQDRYVLFENCKELADFFSSLVEAVGSCSFRLKEDGALDLHPNCEHHPHEGSASDFVALLRERVEAVIATLEEDPSPASGENDTIVYPLVQMGPFDINQEYDLLKRVFALKSSTLSMTMASGYFNCIEDYEKLIFEQGTYSLDVLTAAPKANGFYGASGVSSYIPSMYSWVAERFLNQIKLHKRTSVTLHEYMRDGWTFHAKGMWIESPIKSATIIGSSNYGFRSVHRDLEAQVLLVTSNPGLRSRLKEERSLLFEFSSLLDGTALRRPDHHVPMVVRMISRIIRNFF